MNTAEGELVENGFSKNCDEWFVEEDLPLGHCFGIQEAEDERLKCLLHNLNLNFGKNKKPLCKQRMWRRLQTAMLMTNLKLLSWNLRGSNSPKKHTIRRKHRPHFAVLQEKKRSSLLVLLLQEHCEETVHTSLCNLVWSNDRWACCNVYGPCGSEGKVAFWQKIIHVGNYWGSPVVVFGDFNVVSSIEERSGSDSTRREVRDFNHVVDDLGLLEFDKSGRVSVIPIITPLRL